MCVCVYVGCGHLPWNRTCFQQCDNVCYGFGAIFKFMYYPFKMNIYLSCYFDDTQKVWQIVSKLDSEKEKRFCERKCELCLHLMQISNKKNKWQKVSWLTVGFRIRKKCN